MNEMGSLNESDYLNYYYNFTNETHDSTHFKTPTDMLSVVLYSVTCVLGIPGNAFVVWIAGVKMKRTVNTIWFLNLAVADFLCCLSIPFSVAEILLDHHWPYGNVLCKLLPTVIVLNMFASVFTLALISTDRCLLVIKPVWCQNHRSTTLASIFCAVSWFLSLVLSLPSMIFRQVEFNSWSDETVCRYGDEVADHASLIQLSRFVFGFLAPIVVITVCYSLILRRVSSRQFSKSQKPMRIILAVIVAFFLCWFPYHVFGLMLYYGTEANQQVAFYFDQLSVSLAYLNSCLNPILYVFMGQDFKEKARLSLRRVLESAFSEATRHSSICSKGEPSQTSNSAQTHV